MSALESLQDLRQEDPDAAVIALYADVFKRNGNVVGFLDIEAAWTAVFSIPPEREPHQVRPVEIRGK